VFALLTFLTYCIIAPIVLLVGYLLYKGITGLSWNFITSLPEKNLTAGGIWPAVVGTVYLVIGTVTISLPLGVLAAIYLNEYASQGFWTRSIRLAVVNLSGVPSIIFGLFGLSLFVIGIALPFNITLFGFGKSVIAGALTLAIMVLPLIITTTENALRAVPISFREASLGLGATKWQTLWRAVLPSALPGILTGLVLAVGRAAGETAPILFTAAVLDQTRIPGIFDVGQPVMALPYHLYMVALFLPGAPDDLKWRTAVVLVTIVLAFNASALIIRSYYRRKQQW
jgi:phosphate transport system permease protein